MSGVHPQTWSRERPAPGHASRKKHPPMSRSSARHRGSARPGATHLAGSIKSLSATKKVIASVALVGSAAGIAGLGTFGTFTSTTNASRTDASGTVVIALGASGASTDRLSVNSSGLVPGDTIQRSVDLLNTGSQALASVTLTTVGTTTSLLDSDATNGLQLVVDKCTVPWTEAGTTPAFTYTCSGTTSSVIATRPVIGATLAMANLSSLTAGATDHLRVTETFPSVAPNTLQGLTSTISYTFNATQRTATNQ